MAILNTGKPFNIWDKIALTHNLKVSDGQKQFTLPRGMLGFIVKTDPLMAKLYETNQTLALEPSVVQKL